MKITEEQVQALWKNPYMLLRREPDAKVYTIKPDTEWLQKMTCELHCIDDEEIHVPTHQNGSVGCGDQCINCGGNALACDCPGAD